MLGVVCVGVVVICVGCVGCVGCGVCSVCVHAYVYGHVVRVYICARVQCEKFEDEYNSCVGANGVYMLWTYTTVTAILFTLLGWVYIDWFKLPYRNVDDVFFK